MSKPNLFQFWNSVPPPAEIMPLIAGWEADPDFAYQRFDTATAGAFIAGAIGDRAASAYRQCANPAMQSDYFRYCALYARGGVYVDARTRNRGNLARLVAGAATGILMQAKSGHLQNGFIFVRAAGNPLLERLMTTATRNIEQRISNSVWSVTGPSILMELQEAAATRPLFDGFDLLPRNRIARYLTFETELAYRKARTDWRYALEHPEENISIFHDPAGA